MSEPSERYSYEHRMAMDAIGFAYWTLSPQELTLKRLVEAERSMHSFMHITDPTFYMMASGDEGLKLQVEMANAALEFVARIQAVKEKLAKDNPGETLDLG